MNITLVRFVKKSRPYNSGEVAGFETGSDLLKDLIKRGIVELVPEEEANRIREEAAARNKPVTGSAGGSEPTTTPFSIGAEAGAKEAGKKGGKP